MADRMQSQVDVPVSAISGNSDLSLNKIADGQKALFLLVNLVAVVSKGFPMQNADEMI